ncbi:uncharacterized protein JCM6883_000299 [Sporobolomyces salmoneus]|uniref:uncharacterized protein n=1 Tax=Sporobolomyces salmoneus TaxID=183962 RepID=UPI003179DE8F
MKTYTLKEIEQHKSTDQEVWLVVDQKVYDVTPFLENHPGGKKVLLNAAGTDASEKFWQFHNQKILDTVASKFLIGTVGEAPQAAAQDGSGEVNGQEEETEEEEEEDDTYFGDLVPFGDPSWYQDWSSPYYKPSHYKVRRAIRKFTDTYLIPNAYEWDQAKEIPPEEYKRIADFGILCAIAAGGTGWPDEEYSKGIPVPGGIPSEEWDAFHNLILLDELSRCASGGIMYGLLGGFGISIGPILAFGSSELKSRLVGPLLRGEIRSCLAITEAEGGSDVANLTREAKKTPDGQYYVVNGAAKWITNGVYSEIFVTAVRTGGKGMGGISLVVVERKFGGVKTRKMECMGVLASGTSYVEFDEVKVPVGNLLGKENKGFALIMHNFSGERAGIAIQANRFARILLEESIKYACKRKTFGKPMIEHPVIRAKMANMAQRIESTHAWLENVVYQTQQYDADTLTIRGGGTMALLKAQASDTFEYCAKEAAQIFGGLAYTKGGQAEKVERLYREVLAYSIPGGSTEIMKDISIRQATKVAQIMGAKL